MDADEESCLIMDSLETAIAEGARHDGQSFVLEQREDDPFEGEFIQTPSLQIMQRQLSPSSGTDSQTLQFAQRQLSSSSFVSSGKDGSLQSLQRQLSDSSFVSTGKSKPARRHVSIQELPDEDSVRSQDVPELEGESAPSAAPSAPSLPLKRTSRFSDNLTGDSHGKVMADGPWQYTLPRVRRPGLDGAESYESHKPGHGYITREEAMWLILISLGFAKNRDQLESNHDVVHYILHFFILWTILYSCILYSARFNDRDLFHTSLWMLVLMGLLFLISSLDEGAVTMGISACFLHCLIGIANARVAYHLEEARVYCSWLASQSFVNAALMIGLALVNCMADTYQVLLWINVFLQPVMYTVYKAIISYLDYKWPNAGDHQEGFGSSCHVPADFSYIFARWQGVHVLATVGAFFSSLAIYTGHAIAISASSRVVAMCGFGFALVFKTSILDVDRVSGSGPDSMRHPYRRNNVTSRIFLLLFPYSVLCIALTGMGFYIMTLDAAGLAAQPTGRNTEDFARKLMTISPACAWFVLTTNKLMTRPRAESSLLHQGREVNLHFAKVGLLYFLSVAFFVPALLEFTREWTAIWVFTDQIFILLVMLIAMFLEKEERESRPEFFNRTRTLKQIPSEYGTWQLEMEEPKLMQTWDEWDKKKIMSSQIDTHELFSTVLLGVSLFTMALDISRSNSIRLEYAICFVAMYGSFASMMRYSSRFSLKDLIHRTAWSIYQFFMLLQILSMNFNLDTLFAVATTCQFAWIALGFWSRIAWTLPKGRPYALYSLFFCLILAMIASVRIFTAGSWQIKPVLIGLTFFSLFCEPTFNLVTYFFLSESRRKAVVLPMNIEYIHNRMNGTYITIISVCLTKCGALTYFGTTKYPGLAAVCVAMIGFNAISVMSYHFHTDVVSAERHAIRRGEICGEIYLFLHPCVLISMALIGGSTLMIFNNVGEYGFGAYNHFAKDLLCLSVASFKFLVVVMKNLHKPRTDDSGPAAESCHRLRRKISAMTLLLSLVPLPLGSMGDFSTLIYITVVNFGTRWLQLLVNAIADWAKKEKKNSVAQCALKRKAAMRRDSSTALI